MVLESGCRSFNTTSAGCPAITSPGTLDPPATGLLPLVLGRATRLARFLPHSPKRYVGTLRLGWTSSTDDAEFFTRVENGLGHLRIRANNQAIVFGDQREQLLGRYARFVRHFDSGSLLEHFDALIGEGIGN